MAKKDKLTSDGVQYSGSGDFTYSFTDLDEDFTYAPSNIETRSVTYDVGSLGEIDLFSDDDLKDKYPALKQAFEHYQSVLEICKTKEREDEN